MAFCNSCGWNKADEDMSPVCISCWDKLEAETARLREELAEAQSKLTACEHVLEDWRTEAEMQEANRLELRDELTSLHKVLSAQIQANEAATKLINEQQSDIVAGAALVTKWMDKCNDVEEQLAEAQGERDRYHGMWKEAFRTIQARRTIVYGDIADAIYNAMWEIVERQFMENEKMRNELTAANGHIGRLSAGLQKIADYTSKFNFYRDIAQAQKEIALEALESTPAESLARLRKLEAVAETAKAYLERPKMNDADKLVDLANALAALKGEA